MGLDWWESFGYSTTVLDYFTSTTIDVGSSMAINATAGRSGGPALRITCNAIGSRTNRAVKTLPGSSQTKYETIAFKLNLLPLPGVTFVVYEWRQGGAVQVDMRVNSNGEIIFTRAGTSLGGPTGQMVFANVYFQAEVRVKIDPSVGEIEMRLGGSTSPIYNSGAALNTRATATSLIDAVALCFTSNGQTTSHQIDFCHPVVRDDTWSGDAHIDYKPGNAAGSYAQWTPSAGSNFQNIGETGSPNDGDHNTTAVVGNRDSFPFDDIPSTAVPIAVCPMGRYSKQDAGAAQVNNFLRVSAADHDAAAFNPPFGSNQYFKNAFLTNPATTNPWTAAEVNATETGYRRAA